MTLIDYLATHLMEVTAEPLISSFQEKIRIHARFREREKHVTFVFFLDRGESLNRHVMEQRAVEEFAKYIERMVKEDE